MEDNKELMNEQSANEAAAEKTPAGDTPEVKAESAASKRSDIRKWGSGAVTKKFMALALAATVLINAGVTAGVMALTGKHKGHDRPDMKTGGRPGTEMHFKNGPGSDRQMAPPQNGQDNNGQTAPSQNGQNSSKQKTPPAEAGNNAKDQSANDGAANETEKETSQTAS